MPAAYQPVVDCQDALWYDWNPIMRMNSTKMKPSPCPTCGGIMDGATQIHNRPVEPKPGDITICLHCGALNQYDDDLKIVTADPSVLNELDPIVRAEIERIMKRFALNRTN